MDGAFFVMSVLGIGLVMWWVVQNDRVPPDRPTAGIFALLPGGQVAKRRRRLRKWVSSVVPAAKRRKSKFD